MLRALRIVPVAISYEYDPCDALKAAELLELSQTGNYSKTADEDLSSVIAGCIGAKGRVHISFGRPLAPDSDDSAAVAQQIDRQILADYMLQPSNYLACEMLGKSFVTGRCSADGQPYRRAGLAAEVRHFEARIAAMAPELRDQVLTMYGESGARAATRAARGRSLWRAPERGMIKRCMSGMIVLGSRISVRSRVVVFWYHWQCFEQEQRLC